MAIKIETLRCFTTVAHCGNLTAAAVRLGRTPSAISMTLRQFEDHFGAPLFESGRKSRLTALGSFALDESTRVLSQFEQSVAAISNFARSESGFVRVAAVPSVAGLILPEVVRTFLGERPGVRLDIRDLDSAGIVRELEKERIDIGLATSTGAGADIEREELFTDAFGVVCRTDHPLVAEKAPLNWHTLSEHPFIANGICAQIMDSVFQEILVNARLAVRNTTSLLAMVRAGVGITVLPRLVVSPKDSKLAFLPVADGNALRRIDILRAANVSQSPAAQRFEDDVRRAAHRVVSDW